ncbi:MAG: bifunctional pyr operon transcriptional regulator/uracil phosphoribosyltransferase PyrR [Gammaproteobacteria bacterium]
MKTIDASPLIEKLPPQIESLIANNQISDPLMIGIHTGGAWIAGRLHQALSLQEPLGSLDISFYRDDFTRIGMNPQVKPSRLPSSVDDRHIILVDDVLYTGRTIRAALNEIFDYGRPASVSLVVLVERSGRELPIQADCTGQHMELGDEQHIKLQGPEPLSLILS